MARMTQAQLDALLASIGGGQLAHAPTAKTQKRLNPGWLPGDPESEKYLDTADDVEQWVSPTGYTVQAIHNQDGTWEVIQNEPPSPKTNAQTPDQAEAVRLENAHRQQINQESKDKRAQEIRENNERSYNQQQTGYAETHAERAARELRALQERRAQEQQDRLEKNDILQAQNQQRQNEIAAGSLANQNRQTDIAAAREAREASKPDFLSQADDKTPYVVRYNPTTNQMESANNPNYDKVKAEAEQIRQNLATQIQAGTLQLEQAKQQYAQWFDTNVKTPLALAQEARDKAAEQRAALDAEERRRQFASTFSLQKGELGQRAGAAAMQAEESLLPYRAGPDEAADMSSAINSLGAGGSMNTNASAGINFKASDFEFNAPDFKSIAKKAAKDALSGISSYIPSDEKYSTADYSGIPSVNTGGAPSTPDVSSGLQGILSNLTSKYQYAAP